ncbi:hypothetical protein D3218_13685 [Aureimonas flava]|uniref:Uncharacterized protein n=1 Tax=Aureimonas flava TaxID=2320271 RepID=A0A3A1WIQ8_9HYPH|nr:hypothetical protein D3218_13685 [Aureimonas flava]
MKVECSRSWLLVEMQRFAFTIIWPGSPAAGCFSFPDDRSFGWTTEDAGGPGARETRFFLGRVFATLERKPVGLKLA